MPNGSPFCFRFPEIAPLPDFKNGAKGRRCCLIFACREGPVAANDPLVALYGPARPWSTPSASPRIRNPHLTAAIAVLPLWSVTWMRCKACDAEMILMTVPRLTLPGSLASSATTSLAQNAMIGGPQVLRSPAGAPSRRRGICGIKSVSGRIQLLKSGRFLNRPPSGHYIGTVEGPRS
jgi:hypothetical protein